MPNEEGNSYQVVLKKKHKAIIPQNVTFDESRTEKGTESADGQMFTDFVSVAKVKNVTTDKESEELLAHSPESQLLVPTNNEGQNVMYPVDSRRKNNEVI